MATKMLLLTAMLGLSKVVTGNSVRAVEYTDKFDNMPGLSPPASPIGNTAGGALVYNTWEYYDVQALAPTLQAKSPPNVATYGAAGETANGQPVWKPMNSSILFFYQKSLAYGCVSNTLEAAAPVTCTLQVSGVRTDGITVVQELAFDPAVLGSKLNTTTFPQVTFGTLKSVSFQVIQAGLPTDTISPVVDNNNYIAYYRG